MWMIRELNFLYKTINKIYTITLSVTKSLLHHDDEQMLPEFSGHNYGSYILYSVTHTGKILNSSVFSPSLFVISLCRLKECPFTIIFHKIFSMRFSKPFRQAFSINIIRNKILACNQRRMVGCLYLEQKKKWLAFKILEVWK
jgi:hypothetical protein